MPVADAQRSRKISDPCTGKGMLFDAGHGGADQSADGIDRRQSGRPFRTATQARSEACAFGRRRIGIKAHIFSIRRTCRANRPAINMRRGDADIKTAIKPAIARSDRAVTSIRVEFHGARVALTEDKYSPFSDLDIGPDIAP